MSRVPHAAWLEVDVGRIERNIRGVRRLVKPRGIWVVVKANAYGHGALLAARAARRAGAIGVCTFGLDESLEVLPLWSKVLNLAYPFEWDIPELVEMGIEQSVWDAASAIRLDREARRRRKSVGVHIKVDTGMNRVGVPLTRAVELAHQVQALPGLDLRGVFTTLAERKGMTEAQLTAYRGICDRIETEGIRIPMRHVASSAGLKVRGAWFDAVRVGIACYGFTDTRGTKPGVRYKARVVDIKRLKRGETAGYGDLFRATRPTTIAVVSAGWSDGLFRSLSNAWKAEVRGKTVALRGRISANHCYLDVTGTGSEPRVGDVATLVGGRTNGWEEAAQVAGSSIYEILTRLPQDLPRVERRRT
jgi:alanine racemase